MLQLIDLLCVKFGLAFILEFPEDQAFVALWHVNLKDKSDVAIKMLHVGTSNLDNVYMY